MGAPYFYVVDLRVTSDFCPSLPFPRVRRLLPFQLTASSRLACDHDSLSHYMDVIFQG